MELSDDLSQLDQGLREAGQSGRLLRFYLLRHFSELVQRLTCSLESDVQQGPLAELAGTKAKASKDEALTVDQAQAEAPYPSSGTNEGPRHGDDAGATRPDGVPALGDGIADATVGSRIATAADALGSVCRRGVCVAVMTMGQNPRKATLAAASAASARPNWRAKARITRLSAQNHPQTARGLPHRAPGAPLDVQYCGEGHARGLQRASKGLKWPRTGPFWRKRPVWPPVAHGPAASRHLLAARDANAHAQAGLLRIPCDRFQHCCRRGFRTAIMITGTYPTERALVAAAAASARPNWCAKARITCPKSSAIGPRTAT